MMVCLREGFEYPPDPATLTERVAYAICAHDVAGGEGRLSAVELRALEAVIEAVQKTYGSPKALSEFIGIGAAPAFQALRRFAIDERYMQDRPHRSAIGDAHVIRADWPNFMGAAQASVSVLLERPEAAKMGEG